MQRDTIEHREGAQYHCLAFDDGDVLWLRLSRGSPFRGTGHIPLVANSNRDGKTEFVALCISRHWGTIVDGAKKARYWNEYGKEMHTSDFSVLVLKWNPDHYHRNLPVEAIDITGPFGWQRFDTKFHNNEHGFTTA